MNTSRLLGALSATTVLVLLLGCEHEESTAPARFVPGVTNPQAPDVDSAVVDQLASAACDREQRCFESGPSGQRFASRDDCMGHLRQMMTNDLSTYDCAKGFEHKGLEHCASTISSEECTHPLDTLSRKDDCRPRSICIQ
jgi:hypothetical protein